MNLKNIVVARFEQKGISVSFGHWCPLFIPTPLASVISRSVSSSFYELCKHSLLN